MNTFDEIADFQAIAILVNKTVLWPDGYMAEVGPQPYDEILFIPQAE